MTPPAVLWRCETRTSDLTTLARAVRAYLGMPGARTMTATPPPLTPLEAALTLALPTPGRTPR